MGYRPGGHKELDTTERLMHAKDRIGLPWWLGWVRNLPAVQETQV